ncbi:preprotein translocase subunit SecG [Patescibacteria group bacterium]|nr:preprotein translocase subunit SecG [Patescibacteria group bacterium]
MNYLNVGKIAQILISVLLMVLTLVQSKGTGLAQGLKSSFSGYRSMRGVERIVFIATIVATVLFVANSLFIIALS